MGFSGAVGEAAWGILLLGFAYAAYTDWRTREAPDGLWSILGVAGLVLGVVALWPDGLVAVGAWVLVGALILQHFVPWDAAVERYADALPGIIEIAAYVLLGAILGVWAYRDGLGTGGVPPVALAAYVGVLLARAMFELGLLYGGADAKALIAAAALIPLDPPTLLALPLGSARVATILPGPFTLLMNAAILTAAIPVGLALRNAARREFDGLQSFVGYRIPVVELPEHFVWLKDPVFGRGVAEDAAVETTEEDVALRRRQRDDLLAKGVDRVWVTPQIPFLLFFFLGA
ncbi:MAG: hypothetical protein L3K08_08945, partial [Thermoplasmata archaeon]|nr:hypothetical protein [Thermoplasmata archaeon]